jgi:4'-phosphopantetheinyl transferase
VVARYVDADPAGLVIDRSCRRCGRDHGRPVLTSHGQLGISISRSAHAGLVAVRRGGGAVGVDVEVVREVPTPMEVARRVLTTAEVPAIEATPPEARARALLRQWTRKEAVLKATGWGLAADHRSFSVLEDPLPTVVRDGTIDERWSVLELDVARGIVASLAICR